MKRYNRMSANALCIIPRKAIAYVMLAMAVLTILSFLTIEVRRLMRLKDLASERNFEAKQTRASLPLVVNTVTTSQQFLARFSENVTKSDHKKSKMKNSRQKEMMNVVEDLFEDQPLCQTKPFLLILVTSSPENFERRDAIRKTWARTGNLHSVSSPRTKTVFLVGRSANKFLNILLQNEKELSGDTLLGPYLDSYRNLTLKVMHGFKWTLRHCQPAFVLKTDDDCFVNLALLLEFLWSVNPVQFNLYAGRVKWSSPVVRDPNSRWYVSSAEFPAPRYAPYVAGAGYVLSLNVLRHLVEFSDRVNIFPNEDAYVGVVLNRAGVRPTYSSRFVTHAGPWQMCNFLYLFVVHRVKAVKQREFQDMADMAMERCPKTDMVKDWV